MLYNRDNGTGGKERALWEPSGQGRTHCGRHGDSGMKTAFLKLPNNQQVHLDGRAAHTVPQGRAEEGSRACFNALL